MRLFGRRPRNAADREKIAPATVERDANIAEMKAKMRPLGLPSTGSARFAPAMSGITDWNQGFFLKMLGARIAYKKTQGRQWVR